MSGREEDGVSSASASSILECFETRQQAATTHNMTTAPSAPCERHDDSWVLDELGGELTIRISMWRLAAEMESEKRVDGRRSSMGKAPTTNAATQPSDNEKANIALAVS